MRGTTVGSHTFAMSTRHVPRAFLTPLVLAVVAPLLLSGCSASFRPNGADEVDARSAGDAAADRLLDQVTEGAVPVGSAVFDLCTEGQHNWKRHDDYDHECDLAHSRVVPAAATPADVDGSLRSMHLRILGAGCTLLYGRSGLEGVADVYWPSRQQMANPSPGAMPSAQYSCATGDGPPVELEVHPYAAGRDETYDLRPDVMLTPYIATRTLRSEPFAASTADTVSGSGLVLHYVVTAKVAYLVV
jgi:hypothetical protein